ncbi:MAG: dethiobiotin synthase [Candidatus Binatia bacterium]
MGKGIFITGTDTGVGKTWFTCGLAALLKNSGYRVGVMKPAETGCVEKAGQLFADDAWRLKSASGCVEPIETICPYRLPEPLAPSIAAERAGVKIDIDRLLTVCGDICAKHDITLVEGAGGLMAPLVPSFTFADFARVAKLPIIVVAANKLGVVNHLLLTLEHASCKGLTTLGYVLNRVMSESSIAADTNREVLAGLTAAPCLGDLPYVSETGAHNRETLDRFAKELDLGMIELVLRIQ